MKFHFLILIALVLLLGCVQDQQAGPMGAGDSPGVVGGEAPKASISGWSSTVKVRRFGRMHCTGTLIGPRLVLTAAHCLRNSVSNDFEIVFPSAPGRTRLVVAHKVHPEYRRKIYREGDLGRNGGASDLALMLLDMNAPPSAQIAQLPAQPLSAGQFVLRIYGYGRTSMNQDDGDILRTVEVLGKVAEGSRDKISIDQRQGKGLCHGDSGGPLFIYEKDKAILVGITSGADRWQTDNGKLVGDSCKYFGTATEVGTYVSWILRTAAEFK